MANKPEQNLSSASRGILDSGLDLETRTFSASGRGRSFFLTSLFIELIDPESRDSYAQVLSGRSQEFCMGLTAFATSRVAGFSGGGSAHRAEGNLSMLLGVSSGVISAGAWPRLSAGWCRSDLQHSLINRGVCASLHCRAFRCNCLRMDFKSRAFASFATRATQCNNCILQWIITRSVRHARGSVPAHASWSL